MGLYYSIIACMHNIQHPRGIVFPIFRPPYYISFTAGRALEVSAVRGGGNAGSRAVGERGHHVRNVLRMAPFIRPTELRLSAIELLNNSNKPTKRSKNAYLLSYEVSAVHRAFWSAPTWQSETARAVNWEIQAKEEMMFMMPTAQDFGSAQALPAARIWRMTRTM